MEIVSDLKNIEVIREVFAYISRFKGKTFVIKIDDDIIDYEYFPVLLKDISILHQAGIRIIIVPGARNRIEEILNLYNIKSRFHKNIRITDKGMISFVKMAAFDVSNKIMTGLSGNSINAVVGNWVKARTLGIIDGIDFMNSGRVEKIDREPLVTVMENSFIPIFPCIGWSHSGKPYNISSDELAVSISEIVGADKLFFIGSDPVLRSENYIFPENSGIDHDGRISRMDISMVEKFLVMNLQDAEKLEKVSLALDAAKRGVHRIHILNGRSKGVFLEEIFSNLGVGTMIYGNEFELIRKMVPADIPGVLRIMEPFVKEGTLLIRDRQSLLNQIDDFFIYETDGVIHGSAALTLFPDGVGEISAVAVDLKYIKLGIGSRLIHYLIDTAVKAKLKQIFLLTTRTSDWFENIGFKEGSEKDLPSKKRESFNKKRNSKILIYNLERESQGNRNQGEEEL